MLLHASAQRLALWPTFVRGVHSAIERPGTLAARKRIRESAVVWTERCREPTVPFAVSFYEGRVSHIELADGSVGGHGREVISQNKARAANPPALRWPKSDHWRRWLVP